MSDLRPPTHLNNHHRSTLDKIFEHPVSHNIEMGTRIVLLNALGAVEEHHDGKFGVTLGSETEVFERLPHKDLDAGQVLDLRPMLAGAGFGRPTGGSA